MKITIVGITEWEEDERQTAGDASHEGTRAVRRLLAEERDAKEDGDWTKGLPFVCEAESLDDALDQYNEKYCEFDYLKAVDADFDEDR